MHPNFGLLSHSSSNLLHACPRKFELYKRGLMLQTMLSSAERNIDARPDPHTNFGGCVGNGVQNYLLTNDLVKAQFEMFKTFQQIEYDSDTIRTNKKSFWHALHAVEQFSMVRHTVLSNMQLAVIDDKPALELGFSINCGNGYSYRGFLDGLLFDTAHNRLVVLENKTTGWQAHEAFYKNSGQAIGYDLVVDKISKKLGLDSSAYEVIYTVYQTKKQEWELFNFHKSNQHRLRWIKNILLDIKHIAEYAEEDYFPMHGESCFSFARPCEYFGMCDMDNKILFLGGEQPVKAESEDKYQFKFSLDELIAELTT